MAELITYTSDHLILLVFSLGLASLISFVLLVSMEYVSWLRYLLLPILSFVYTIPSLALLVLLIPFLGIGKDTAIVALTLYGVFILTSSLVTAIDSVDDSLVEAAQGMGYGSWDIFIKIKLIYALPAIVSALRLTTISIIGIGTIAAAINAGGLGVLIFQGLSQQRYDKIVIGSLIVAVLALLFNYIFVVLEEAALAYVRGERYEH